MRAGGVGLRVVPEVEAPFCRRAGGGRILDIQHVLDRIVAAIFGVDQDGDCRSTCGQGLLYWGIIGDTNA